MTDPHHPSVDSGTAEIADLARGAYESLLAAGATVATAESLTGGLLAAALTSMGGSSAVFRGGVVAYHGDVKAAFLAVDEAALAARGAVQPDVAAQMAYGVRSAIGADWGVATTGVAGPDPSDGQPVGRVYVAVAGPADAQGPDGVRVVRLDLAGDRTQIRTCVVAHALRLLTERIRDTP